MPGLTLSQGSQIARRLLVLFWGGSGLSSLISITLGKRCVKLRRSSTVWAPRGEDWIRTHESSGHGQQRTDWFGSFRAFRPPGARSRRRGQQHAPGVLRSGGRHAVESGAAQGCDEAIHTRGAGYPRPDGDGRTLSNAAFAFWRLESGSGPCRARIWALLRDEGGNLSRRLPDGAVPLRRGAARFFVLFGEGNAKRREIFRFWL